MSRPAPARCLRLPSDQGRVMISASSIPRTFFHLIYFNVFERHEDRGNLQRRREANETKCARATISWMGRSPTSPSTYTTQCLSRNAQSLSHCCSARRRRNLEAAACGCLCHLLPFLQVSLCHPPFSGVLANGVIWCPCRGWGKEGSGRDGRGTKKARASSSRVSMVWDLDPDDGLRHRPDWGVLDLRWLSCIAALSLGSCMSSLAARVRRERFLGSSVPLSDHVLIQM